MLAILDMGSTMHELQGFSVITNETPARIELFVSGKVEPEVIDGDVLSVTHMGEILRELVLTNTQVIDMHSVMEEVQHRLRTKSWRY